MVIEKKLVIRLLLIVLIVLIVLLFVGGPGHYSSRIYRDVWELGHVILFAILSIMLFRLPFVVRKKLFMQVAIVFFIVILLAGLSEWLQSSVNRTAELIDVRRDIVGAIVGALIVFKQRYRRRKSFLILASVALVLIVIELSPLTKTIIDEYNIYKTGTVLSNLEGAFEDERWKGNSSYALSKDFVIEGEKSLEVIFNTDEYSGITLKYMHRDWSMKNSLHVSIYYPDDDKLLLNVRINDFIHIENNRYNDRFNEKIVLEKGWNYLKFSIDDIENAPKGRKANIDNMQSFGMFVTNLAEPKTIYIDNIYIK